MKKNLESLGTALGRNEAKKIVGGDDEEVAGVSNFFCTCGDSMETVVCHGGWFNCFGSTLSFCRSRGYDSVNCTTN